MRQKQNDFNPRSPHGERQVCIAHIVAKELISIHAPRTGSDFFDDDFPALRAISIHAPRTGSDLSANLSANTAWKFQSTLPARGAT